ncbi:arylsulfatase [Andreprevotia lacus DSM 23236]|jgi:arylsulfatase|uniref:Arylsulfatase n=1 Tax=Andreprevotia lacus DSM 23236 TaxID=1121001 RepID=A0A1W1X528_9NEIS|nr:arylsulfatase [Andreprevotia lacus]SMC19015.1 arylsulfatase [Andreprevotia lacus DSM 23236]
MIYRRLPAALALAGLLAPWAPALAAPRPNIVVIVADDLGFSDVGAFGGEIHTPNLDELAGNGRLLTNFHTAPTSSPTRSMLLSGTDHHLAGIGTMIEAIQPNQIGLDGYEGYLNERSLSLPEILRDAGYHTYMAGKWHLGLTREQGPQARGFEQSFALLQGAGSHFAPVPGKINEYDQVTYRENGKLTTIPADFFSTNFYTDKLIGYLRTQRDDKPFFAYAAYTAPHWPLQAPPDYIDRYMGRYDAGYAAIRAARIAKQKAQGVITADFAVNAGISDALAPRWEQLTPAQQKTEARRMEVYAAMVENLDANVGRLIGELKARGQYDNTLIFFMSDNGAEGGTGHYLGSKFIDNSDANLGKPLSNVDYGRRWAEVGATPFRLWKATSAEGGINTPAIVRLPGQTAGRTPVRAFVSVQDILPTLLELTGIPNPGSQYGQRKVNPITGVSALPLFTDRAQQVRPADFVFADELFGSRYVRRGDWKLVWQSKPLGTAEWQLFDLAADRAEQHDVAADNPDIVADLKQQWQQYVARNGVVLPTVPR